MRALLPVITTRRPDRRDRGYLALEATFNEKWEVLSATIVQVADLDTDDGLVPAKASGTPGYSSGGTLTIKGRRARHPLAVIRKRSSGALMLFQVTHFDLAHRAKVLGTDNARARHFFFPTG